MKRKLLLLAVWVSALRTFGAPPDSPAGYVFYDSIKTIARTGQSQAIVLNTNGTFTGLYSIGVGFNQPTSTLSSPEDGTWSYRKTGTMTAELTLQQNSSNFADKHTLEFTADMEGNVGNAVGGGSFRLAPVDARGPLVNCSNRSFVRAGSSAFTGFVIANLSRSVLVRAVGPGLTQFGVPGVLQKPVLKITHASTNAFVGTSSGRSAAREQAISRTGTLVGAFPLPAGSNDAADIALLGAGAYIVSASSSDSADSGEVLIEVYLLP
jgi:hypothetical protein